MAFNLSTIPDRYLWLSLGIFTLLAIPTISHSLRTIVSLTEIRQSPPPRPPSPQPATHQTHQTLPPSPAGPSPQESFISTPSLHTLALSPSHSLRHSATKILCQRFASSASAQNLLVRDLNSRDEEVRHRAEIAYNMLSEFGVDLGGRNLGNRKGGGLERRRVGSGMWVDHPHPNLFNDADRDGEGSRNNRDVEDGFLDAGGGRTISVPQTGWAEGDAAVAVVEVEARRRRREAVVIHEGSGAIGEGDVYMRD